MSFFLFWEHSQIYKVSLQSVKHLSIMIVFCGAWGCDLQERGWTLTCATWAILMWRGWREKDVSVGIHVQTGPQRCRVTGLFVVTPYLWKTRPYNHYCNQGNSLKLSRCNSLNENGTPWASHTRFHATLNCDIRTKIHNGLGCAGRRCYGDLVRLSAGIGAAAVTDSFHIDFINKQS